MTRLAILALALSACSGAQSPSSSAPSPALDWRPVATMVASVIVGTQSLVDAQLTDANVRALIDAEYAALPAEVQAITAHTFCEALTPLEGVSTAFATRVIARLQATQTGSHNAVQIAIVSGADGMLRAVLEAYRVAQCGGGA